MDGRLLVVQISSMAGGLSLYAIHLMTSTVEPL